MAECRAAGSALDKDLEEKKREIREERMRRQALSRMAEEDVTSMLLKLFTKIVACVR